MDFKLAFIGFGTVGQGLSEILLEKKEMLAQKYNFNFKVVAISDIIKGSIYNKNGLDLRKILEIIGKGKQLDEYPDGEKGLDSIATINDTNANTIVEITYTDVKTGEPALTHIKTALQTGKNVISSNKGPVVKQSSELLNLANKNNVFYGFEGVVLSGTPVINLAKFTLAGNNIKGFKGILNGTTNFILTKMEEGMTYEKALKKAQELGYAEADPTGDVEGLDALGKVVILSNVVLGKNITWEDVERKGITGLSIDDINKAKSEGKRWKLIGSAEIKENDSIKAKVWPEKLPLNDPLAGVGGAINALTFYTDELGPVTIVGPGAGKRETGFALLIDLLEINRKYNMKNKN
jgi:homoserine dehydrogenase